MGDPRGRYGSPHDRFRLFAAALAAAALALAHPAGAQTRSPRGDAPPAGVTGSIVGYQESPGSAILYHEEKGGMLTQVPPPVPKAAAKAKPAAKAAATKAPPPAAAPKLAQQ